MPAAQTGTRAPDFRLTDSDGNSVTMADFKGRWLVLYFYPKDNTSGCTLEAVDFSRALPDFTRLNAAVAGVSPDSEKSHCRFRDTHSLSVLLLSDPDHTVIEQYGAWVLKKMYGREYYGVERSTFLIDPKGTIARSWRKVKVKNHSQEVLDTLKELQSEHQ